MKHSGSDHTTDSAIDGQDPVAALFDRFSVSVTERRGVTWWITDRPVPYPLALAVQEQRVADILAGTAPETVWLLDHPPLYTAGTSAKREDLLQPDRFPVYQAGRGGQYTYHGPGQRIGYLMLDLRERGRDVRRFVCDTEEWIIRTLWTWHIRGERRQGRVGIWVPRGGTATSQTTEAESPLSGGREDKIAAIGIRVRRWISFHGVSLNVDPDLTHFGGIVPCGIAADTDGVATGVTSLLDLGIPAEMTDVDLALMDAFEAVFLNQDEGQARTG